MKWVSAKNDISLIDIPNDMKETRFPFKFLRNTINRQSKKQSYRLQWVCSHNKEKLWLLTQRKYQAEAAHRYPLMPHCPTVKSWRVIKSQKKNS